MAKLYFSYAAMNAGKSTVLLQAAHNYKERGLSPILFTADFDHRDFSETDNNGPVISSRIGVASPAFGFDQHTDFFDTISEMRETQKIDAIFVDEAQFLSTKHVDQCAKIVDALKIPLLCYGLRTDFQGNLFEGSARLLAICDELREIRTICWCSKRANMVLKLDSQGRVIKHGDQIEIGGNEKYVSVCRQHWIEGRIG